MTAFLEYDSKRGVLYVHSMAYGTTLVRVCGLPKDMELGPGRLLDITIRGKRCWVQLSGTINSMERIPSCQK